MSGLASGFMAYQSGKAQQKVAYANAAAQDAASAANLLYAGRDMADTATEGEQAMSTARAQSAASGMTSQGSGGTREARIARQLENTLSTMSSNAAQSDVNARYAADVTRWEGDIAKEQGKTALYTGAFSDAVNLGVGLTSGWMNSGTSWGSYASSKQGFNSSIDWLFKR